MWPPSAIFEDPVFKIIDPLLRVLLLPLTSITEPPVLASLVPLLTLIFPA